MSIAKSKLVIDLHPDLFETFSDTVARTGQSKKYVIENLIKAYLLEEESHPTGRYFKKSAKYARARIAR